MSDVARKEELAQARATASQIRQGIHNYLATLALIARANKERHWKVLGYESWQEYVDGEFGAERLRLPAEHRQKAIEELRLAGLSVRAIGSAVGVSTNTVLKDLSQSETPTEITGTDGKTYAASRPTPEPPMPARQDVGDRIVAGLDQHASQPKLEEVDSATEGSTGSTSSPDQPALPVEADAQLDRVGATNADAREAPTGAAAWTAPVGAGGTAVEVDHPSADADGEGPSQSGPAQSSAAGAPTDLHTAGAPVNPSDLVIAIHGVLRFDVDEFAQNADADQIEELGAAFELLDEFRSKALAALIRANGFAENKAD